MFDVTVTTDVDGIHVKVTTPVAVREDVYAWALPSKDGALASRLARAVQAGVVLTNPVVKTDVNGKTYVSAESQVMGRHMNADLKRLGY
jgi:hypothetical protein